MLTWSRFNFQYCPKIVIFNTRKECLLCKRRWEQDFDGIFWFPWWKREITDQSIEAGITREIKEELGDSVVLQVYRLFNIEMEYVKKAGDTMILPHYLAIYKWGDIVINPDEYSEYRWIEIDYIDSINTIPTVKWIIKNFLSFQEVMEISNDQSFIINN